MHPRSRSWPGSGRDCVTGRKPSLIWSCRRHDHRARRHHSGPPASSKGWGAIASGLIGPTIVYFALDYLSRVAPFRRVDDTLGVDATHGFAGLAGGLFTGVFADSAMGSAAELGVQPDLGRRGADLLKLAGPPGASGSSSSTAVGTFVVLRAWSRLFVPLRMTEAGDGGGRHRGPRPRGQPLRRALARLPLGLPATPRTARADAGLIRTERIQRQPQTPPPSGGGGELFEPRRRLARARRASRGPSFCAGLKRSRASRELAWAGSPPRARPPHAPTQAPAARPASWSHSLGGFIPSRRRGPPPPRTASAVARARRRRTRPCSASPARPGHLPRSVQAPASLSARIATLGVRAGAADQVSRHVPAGLLHGLPQPRPKAGWGGSARALKHPRARSSAPVAPVPEQDPPAHDPRLETDSRSLTLV